MLDMRTADTATTFAPVARKVRVRVAVRRWLVVLRMTLIPATLVLVLLVLAALRGTPVMPWLGLLLWLAGTFAYAWGRRPGEYCALALWDEAAGRREAFATAWWFESRGDESGGQARVHVEAQRQILPQALSALRRDLPLRPDRWLALPLAVAVLGSMISMASAPRSEVLVMDQEMAHRAAEVAKKLAQTDWEKKKLAGLQEEERRQLEELKRQMQKTAGDLASAAGKDTRSVLVELERRARDAEKLADELDGTKEAWASEKLVAALRQHADTADLGDAVASKNTAAAVKAAESLASQLKAPQITPEVEGRMEGALKDALQQSESKDRQRVVGQNVLSAGDRMQAGDAPAAGAEFQKLADKLRDVALRDQARNELRQLAQQLRDSGSGIAGQNENTGAMQQMNAQAAPSQGQNGSGSQNVPQVGQSSAPQQMTPPGMGQGGRNSMQQQQQQGGQGQQQQMVSMGAAAQGQPGQQGQAPGNGQPMLLAPVPGGGKADEKSPAILMPAENNPGTPDGTLLSITGGGRDPGVGKADLNAGQTQKQVSGRQSLVGAQQNNEGQSSVRTVEGGAHAEQSSRSATQTALDAIQAEEAALDESPLPPSRRDQVRRYFHELRRRLEGR